MGSKAKVLRDQTHLFIKVMSPGQPHSSFAMELMFEHGQCWLGVYSGYSVDGISFSWGFQPKTKKFPRTKPQTAGLLFR